MNVLIVSPQFPSPALPLNGITDSAFLTHLPRFGINPRVVVPLPMWRSPLHGAVRQIPALEQSGGAAVVHPRYIGLPQRAINKGYGKSVETWIYRRAISREIDRFQAQGDCGILHAHSCVTTGYALLALRRDTPLVVTLHDNDLQTSAKNPRLRHRIVGTLQGANHVIYQSRKLQSIGESLIGPHSSSILPWGVQTYDNILRKEPRSFTVCAVARLVPTKGLDLLIEAFHLLLESVPDARLNIVGKGPERQSLERKIAAHGLNERVKLLGFRPNREAMEHVATASVFVLPSFVEALGVAYLEAMSLGVPVIGVRGQGIGDVIRHGENGLLIAPRDVLAVHDAMLQLARNPTLTRTMGAAAQETFRAGPYAWERNAAEHAELYKSLLETRN